MQKNIKRDAATRSWIMEVVGKNKYNVVLLALVQTIMGASVIGFALFLRGLIDHAVAGDKYGFWRYGMLLIALVLFLVVLRLAKRFLEEYTKSSVENCFKARLFHNILRRDFGKIRTVHTAEWMNRLTSDSKVAADGFTQVIPNLCEMAARLLAAITALIVMQPRFTYIILPGGFLLIIVTFMFRTRLKVLHRRIQEKDGELRVFYQERLSSQIVLRVFSRETQAEEHQKQYLDGHQEARMRRNWFSNLCNAGFLMAMNGAYVLGAIYCGLGILNGTMTYGTFTAVLQLVNEVQSPFANISGALPQYFAMIASADRLKEVEEWSMDVIEWNDSRIEDSSFQSVGLRNVRFAYPSFDEDKEDLSVLENFSMEIQKGEFVAMTGPSGCGKSTALKVLMGLYPIEEGDRYVDFGNGEQDLRQKGRSLFSYVPQGNMLIQGTIREIITFGDSNAMTRETEIWEALRLACADEYVKEMENGLDTELGEHGSGLSEGQIQRLSIARAIFSRRHILVLDEATSALDTKTERRLLDNLSEMKDLTVILVSHRPAALSIADHIIDFSL